MAGSRARRRRKRLAAAAGGEIGGGGSTQQKEPADGPSAMPDEDLKKEPAAVSGLGQGEEGQFRVLERKKSDSPPSSSRRFRPPQQPAPLQHSGFEKLESASSSKPKSYCEATKEKRAMPKASKRQQQARQRQAPPAQPSSDAVRDQSIIDKFDTFLNSFTEGDGNAPFYPSMVKFMKEIGSFNLQVEFEHVLQTDVDMAIDIVNLDQSKRNNLLLPLVRRFLIDQGLGTAEELNQRGTLEFQAMPRSIKRVKEYFAKKHDLVKIVRNLLGLGYDVRTLSNLTKALLRGFAEEIFHTHSEYLSWEGGYGLEDMVVIDHSQFRITKKPSFVFVAGDNGSEWDAARVKDVRRLEELFTPVLDDRRLEERINPPRDKELPLFYSTLRDDLQNVKEGEVGSKWFQEYILNHPALKPAQARHDFICSTYQVLRKPMSTTQEFRDDEDLSIVLFQQPTYDWRMDAAFGSVELLRKVYAHNYDIEHATEKKRKGGGGENKKGDGGENKKGDGGENKKGGDGEASREAILRRFTHNLWGCVRYNRHLLNHVVDDCAISCIPEMEVFASSKMGPYFSRLLRGILTIRLNRKQIFNSVWEVYESSSVLTTDGSKVKHGHRLRFWSS